MLYLSYCTLNAISKHIKMTSKYLAEKEGIIAGARVTRRNKGRKVSGKKYKK
jgi:nitric oxide synthase oxygenase domain/subunit